MAQHESAAQKQTVERVMHEFKHHDLETAGGRRVRNRRQAVAIALSEAGASNRQSPPTNRKRLATTKRREHKAEKSRADLYKEAKRRNVPGRSRMNKQELTRALS